MCKELAWASIAEGKQNCLASISATPPNGFAPVHGRFAQKAYANPGRRAVRGRHECRIRFALPVRLNARTGMQRCANPNQKKPWQQVTPQSWLHQVQPTINTYPIDRVSYARHQKPGSPDSLRAEYWRYSANRSPRTGFVRSPRLCQSEG